MTIVITDHGFKDVSEERTILQAAGMKLEVAQCKTEDQVIEYARYADALLVQWAPVTSRVVAELQACKLIVRYGIGYDNLDIPAARARGIQVCNVPDYCVEEVADHSIALALALARQVPQTHQRTASGVWKITPPGPVRAFSEMLFATAGLGRIARAVINRAKAFGFQIGAFDPFVPPAVFTELGVEQLTEADLFRRADLLSLHLPLRHDTHHFVGGPRLGAMKPNAILINTSRGGLVDTKAVATALIEGRLAGAGLDVFETEPLPDDHPLRTAPNTLLTSHTAWFSDVSVPRLQRLAAEEIVRGLRGESLLHPIEA
jgi:D-3-phosphoglycerate dehydrogenase